MAGRRGVPPYPSLVQFETRRLELLRELRLLRERERLLGGPQPGSLQRAQASKRVA